MKKTKNIALLTLTIAALSMASCKKDRTCTCTGTTTVVTTVSNSSGSTSTTDSSPVAYTNVLAKTTKAAAKGNGECMTRTETFSDSSTNGGTTTKNDYTSDVTCSLK